MANVSCIFSLCGLLVFPLIDLKAANTQVFWGTADYDELANGFATPLEFWGLNAAGAGAAKLARDIYDVGGTPTARKTVLTEGDLVELGYFASDAAGTPSATSADLFLGNYWIPLTSTTRIGMQSEDELDTTENADGRILPIMTNFKRTGVAATDNVAYTNTDADYLRNDTKPYSLTHGSHTGADLTDIIAKLDDRVDGGDDTFLAMRFYDVDPASATGGNQDDLSSGTSRYNTITNARFKWKNDGDPSLLDMVINDPLSTPANLPVGYKMELNSDDYSGTKIGTGSADLGTGDDDEVRTATITYRTVALTLAADTIVSNLDDAVSAANITGDAGTKRHRTVLARSDGTTYTYTGDISTGKTEIHKIGTGTQVFAGAIDTSEALWIDEGTLTLTPANAKTQVFEYISGNASPGSLALDNDNFATHVVELGFVTATTADFAGAVALSDTGANAIKVASGTADADYGKEQVFSGVVSGAAILEKKGVGRLNLKGIADNTFTGAIKIDDGVLVAGHDNALGAGAKTVTINKGKLEVASGITTPGTVTIQGGASRNFIGGDGTVNAVVIGSGANEVDVVTPGQGFSSSLTLVNKQAVRGKATADVSADASIGTFTATTLSLLNGGVYDWEISNFDGTGTAGTDWDLLNFDILNLGAKSDTFNVNAFGIVPDAGGFGTAGEAGTPKDADGSKANLWARGGSKFKFLDGGGASTVNWTGGSQWSTSELTSYFDVNDADLAYSTNMWGGDWTVTYESNAFYLNFSVVPEPSTYVMVTGLLMLPGFQFLRRFRRRKNKGEE